MAQGHPRGYPCPAGDGSGMQVELGRIQPGCGAWPHGGLVLVWGREARLWGELGPAHGQGVAGARWQGVFSPLTVLGIWLTPFMFMLNRT